LDCFRGVGFSGSEVLSQLKGRFPRGPFFGCAAKHKRDARSPRSLPLASRRWAGEHRARKHMMANNRLDWLSVGGVPEKYFFSRHRIAGVVTAME